MTAPGRPATWLRRVGDLVEPDDNPTLDIYGVITAGSLLSAERSGQETTLASAEAVVVILCLYLLAHAYSSALGERIQQGRTISAVRLFHHLGHSVAILRGALVPLVVLLLAWAAGGNNEANVLAARISAAVTIVLLEIVAARRARLRGIDVLTQLFVSLLLGLGVLIVRFILH